MKTLRWMIGLVGVALISVSCTNQTANDQTQTPTAETNTSEIQVAETPAQALRQTPGQTLNNPSLLEVPIPPGEVVRVPPAPGLIQPTIAAQRLPQVSAGRDDPFAAIAAAPEIRSVQRVATGSVPRLPSAPENFRPANGQPSAQLPTAPVFRQPSPAQVSTVPLPALVPAPDSGTVSPLPSVSVASSPATFTNAIEISGIVQAGERVSAIVTLPNEPSRSVSAGDYLANGRVLVKRIDVGVDAEPFVVLELDGREVVKSVGSSAVL